MKKFFEIDKKSRYTVTKSKYIDISTLLGQFFVTVGVLQGVTSVTNSLLGLKLSDQK